jgi:hypothetical protein
MIHNVENIKKLVKFLRSKPDINYYWANAALRNYYKNVNTTDLSQPGAAEHLITFKVFKDLTERYKEHLASPD